MYRETADATYSISVQDQCCNVFTNKRTKNKLATVHRRTFSAECIWKAKTVQVFIRSRT